MKRARFLGVISASCWLIACGDGTSGGRTSGALVTFAVQSETFRVWLTASDQIAAARRAQAGGPAFGGGRYCPWSATVIRIEDR